MLLKKQTVWLLTMLSLVVVLSVYYLTSPDGGNQNIMTNGQEEAGQEKKEEKADTKKEESAKNEKEESSVTIASGDDDFDALRMQIEDERAKLSEELTAKMGDTALTEEERNEAYETIEKMSETKVQENIIENLIVSMDYDAALVRVEGNDIKVSVKADKHSPTEANNIIRLVQKEIGSSQNVSIDFQPEK
ncbi:SpoIIIAH-like family protein [Bacillus massiliglaciei]|uniref:SpoIIIAH-like family protein n=1 Tax=Bacillus massiliglaciei TaxID=1816693 RepID=UPI000AF313C6|nr:SpoIIIAH-like family protein [Bacillus massiliglaciei]